MVNLTTIDIVDGQQRITTIIIFMKLLVKTTRKSKGIDVTLPKTHLRSRIFDNMFKLSVYWFLIMTSLNPIF